jgi:hypothetical protein
MALILAVLPAVSGLYFAPAEELEGAKRGASEKKSARE